MGTRGLRDRAVVVQRVEAEAWSATAPSSLPSSCTIINSHWVVVACIAPLLSRDGSVSQPGVASDGW